ncbi:hypothetical protein RRG08_044035 [Elysia crispata]|uniref:Uncharacterized protein n=1 Tax=Elysia crispata TaxID=231223 RepID=A0AAE1CQV2_9GAST|nr:hypothetical protein RRG08_044035 [Elysia crispata]
MPPLSQSNSSLSRIWAHSLTFAKILDPVLCNITPAERQHSKYLFSLGYGYAPQNILHLYSHSTVFSHPSLPLCSDTKSNFSLSLFLPADRRGLLEHWFFPLGWLVWTKYLRLSEAGMLQNDQQVDPSSYGTATWTIEDTRSDILDQYIFRGTSEQSRFSHSLAQWSVSWTAKFMMTSRRKSLRWQNRLNLSADFAKKVLEMAKQIEPIRRLREESP